VSADSIKVADSLKFKTPKGKIVYGGGGIIPDVFVPIGTNEEEALESMDSMGFFSRFIFEYLDEDRQQFKNLPMGDFVNDYVVDDILFERFVDFSLDRNLKLNFYDYDTQIKLYLKAALAEQLYDSNLYAKIKGQTDPMLKKVIMLDNPVDKRDESTTIESQN
jgi:carboxyl-terminal processing protease